jgi:hypothetical protein
MAIEKSKERIEAEKSARIGDTWKDQHGNVEVLSEEAVGDIEYFYTLGFRPVTSQEKEI